MNRTTDTKTGASMRRSSELTCTIISAPGQKGRCGLPWTISRADRRYRKMWLRIDAVLLARSRRGCQCHDGANGSERLYWNW
jgi:hypothetical protein